ncbi:MAG: hypothetical protein K2I48_04305 [Muribaculaceae bacterium]|nr:hypothetical protein [Muribaculaceae bacterium]
MPYISVDEIFSHMAYADGILLGLQGYSALARDNAEVLCKYASDARVAKWLCDRNIRRLR